jgi:hypothetical protein
MVAGVVLQDVVADALTSDIVPRCEADGTPRPQQAIVQEMAMVQVLARFTMLLGILLAGLAGAWAAQNLPVAVVLLIALAIPGLTAAAAIFGDIPNVATRPLDWTILAGGVAIAAITVATAAQSLSGAQELSFAASFFIVCALLWRIARELDADTRRAVVCFAAVAFALRSEPWLGMGYTWYSTDVLKFDEAFFTVLQQTSSSFGLIGLWVMCRIISRNNQTRVFLWLTCAAPLLALPVLSLILGAHHWIEATLGVDARQIALLSASYDIRVTNLLMIAMLTLTAFYAPEGRRATWFALMTSIFNLALQAGALQTKYLSLLFPVERGNYEHLPVLAIATVAVGTVVSLLAVLTVGRRLA